MREYNIGTLERAKAMDDLLFHQHAARYYFAADYIQSKKVLDFGCGEGYGSEIMLETAGNLVALDISSEAVRITRDRLKIPVIQADARYAPFSASSFEVLVSFEVFEHITSVDKYIAEACRILTPGGSFIFSTPNVETHPLAGLNPYHVREYTVNEVRQLVISAGFSKLRIFGQVAAKPEVANIQNSKLLLMIMKIKRKLGFHGNLLPTTIRRSVNRKLAGGELGKYEQGEYRFIEGKLDEPELTYIAEKPSSFEGDSND